MIKTAFCVLASLVLVTSSAGAQAGRDPVQLYMLQLLGSPDPTLRQRALREIEAAAATLPPPVLALAASRLAEAQDYEAALTWSYFSELRLRTDLALNTSPLGMGGLDPDLLISMFEEMIEGQMPARIHQISSERRRTLFARAVRMDERIGRAYPPGWDEVGAGAEPTLPTTWPPRGEIARARARARTAARTRLEERFRSEATEDQIARDISTGAVPAEARDLIPAAIRGRVTTRVAASLVDAGCGRVTSLLSTPLGAPAPAFVIRCSVVSGGVQHLWIDQSDGHLIGATVKPEATHELGAMALRNGTSYLVYLGRNRDIVLVAPDGGIDQIAPPPLEGASNHASLTQVTRSGRYGLFGGATRGLLDFETNRWVWQQQRATTADVRRDAPMTPFAHVGESASGSPYLVGLRRADNQSDLVVLDISSARERTLSVAGALSTELRSGDEVLVRLSRAQATAVEPSTVRSYANEEEWRTAIAASGLNRAGGDPRATIVNLESMQSVWTGPVADAPAETESGCTIARDPMMLTGRASPSVSSIRLDGQLQPIDRPERAAPDACNVSADGARMMIVVAPFAYIYELSPQ